MKKPELLLPRPTAQRIREREAGFVRNEIVNAERAQWTNDEYHSKHAGGTVSRSELATFADNPNIYRQEILLRRARGAISDAMRFGQCLHMELLHGHEKPARVPDVGDSGCPLTKDGKRMGNAWKCWRADNGPYYVLPKEAQDLDRMVEKVRKNDAVKMFLDHGSVTHGTLVQHETTILATHGPTGLRTRCRYDIEACWLFDIKKCHDASPEGFASHCVDFGYHCQGAFYQDHNASLHGERDYRPFILIAIQDGADYRCEVYEMSAEFIAIGRQLNSSRLDLFAMYQAAWEKLAQIERERGVVPDTEEIWVPASEGKIQFLQAPNKAIYAKDWEPDPLEVHKVLTERVQRAIERAESIDSKE